MPTTMTKRMSCCIRAHWHVHGGQVKGSALLSHPSSGSAGVPDASWKWLGQSEAAGLRLRLRMGLADALGLEGLLLTLLPLLLLRLGDL